MVLVVKNPSANGGDMRPKFDPWVGKISWRRTWQSTPVFLPGEYHGQSNYVRAFSSSWEILAEILGVKCHDVFNSQMFQE